MVLSTRRSLMTPDCRYCPPAEHRFGQEAILENETYDVALTCHELASLLADEGGVDQAVALYERALAIKRQVLGNEHPEVAATLHNLALLQQGKGAVDEARALWEEARTILEVNPGRRR
jgi:tetratricopeptide (TPR) repeat protein